MNDPGSSNENNPSSQREGLDRCRIERASEGIYAEVSMENHFSHGNVPLELKEPPGRHGSSLRPFQGIKMQKSLLDWKYSGLEGVGYSMERMLYEK